MSTLMELTIVLLICPAALAAWADARYPNLRPTDLRRTAVHLGVTGLLAFGLLRPLADIAPALPLAGTTAARLLDALPPQGVRGTGHALM